MIRIEEQYQELCQAAQILTDKVDEIKHDFSSYRVEQGRLFREADEAQTKYETLTKHLIGMEQDLELMQKRHEEAELGHRQRLADMELAIRKAEDRLQAVRRLTVELSEVMARG